MCEEKTEPQRTIYKSTIPPGDLNTELSVLVVIAEKNIYGYHWFEQHHQSTEFN